MPAGSRTPELPSSMPWLTHACSCSRTRPSVDSSHCRVLPSREGAPPSCLTLQAVVVWVLEALKAWTRNLKPSLIARLVMCGERLACGTSSLVRLKLLHDLCSVIPHMIFCAYVSLRPSALRALLIYAASSTMHSRHAASCSFCAEWLALHTG